MDRITTEIRSKIMSRIRAKNTSPEIIIRKALYAAGIKGYRLHYKLPGRPDIVFVSKRVVIFIDGDFWHGYLWRREKISPPKKYWQAKINGNILRDKKYNIQLKKSGWKVLRFWEHEVKKDTLKIIKKIKKII